LLAVLRRDCILVELLLADSVKHLVVGLPSIEAFELIVQVDRLV